MAESYDSTPNSRATASYQTPDEAEESFLALVRALRAIRANGATKRRPAREHVGRDQPVRTPPAPPAAGTSRS